MMNTIKISILPDDNYPHSIHPVNLDPETTERLISVELTNILQEYSTPEEIALIINTNRFDSKFIIAVVSVIKYCRDIGITLSISYKLGETWYKQRL